MKMRGLVLLAGLLAPATAFAQTAGTLSVLNSGGTAVTIPTDVNGSNNTPHSVPEVAGARVSNTNPLPTINMPSTNAMGTVGVTALPPLVAGTAAIGTVGVTALPALPAGGNAIGTVVVTSTPLPTGAATAAGQEPVTAAGTTATSAAAVQGVTGGVPMPISGTVTQAGAIPAGANAIGTVGVTALPSLPAGSNLIGNVGVTTTVLPTGAATAANQVHPTLWQPGTQSGGSTALAVTVGTYPINTVVGGPIQFAGALGTAGGSAAVNGAQFYLASQTAQPTLALLLFSRPLTGTYTDHATFTIAAADMPYFLGRLISDPLWVPAGSLGVIGTTLDTARDVTNTATTPTTTVYALLVTEAATYAPTLATDLATSGVVLETTPH